MILGIGVDIESTARFAALCADDAKNAKLVQKIYSADERLLFQNTVRAPLRMAANFCAKEAFFKTLGEKTMRFGLCEVEILRDENGAPYIKLSGRAKELYGEFDFMVSLSHTDDTATAFVVRMKKMQR